jgi:putative phosphoserine phosphatase/1-acylglycerol-3-phosphate O-acyltransferase
MELSPGRAGAAVFRTAAGAAGLSVATAAAVSLGVVNHSRRLAVNLLASAGTELSLALAGITLEVVGEEHLWSHRPAVFVFNHQSALDVVVIANLLRRDVTGVVKREAAHDPRFVVLGALADVAYVDRHDHTQAIAALGDVVRRIGDGVSIAIAPEGTRSRTGAVGPFKTGAFHMAHQAGVPVVPIVIRDTGPRMPVGSLLVRPGTVHVVVLPPIDVSGWDEGEFHQRVDAVRARFVETLERVATVGVVGPGRVGSGPKDPDAGGDGPKVPSAGRPYTES